MIDGLFTKVSGLTYVFCVTQSSYKINLGNTSENLDKFKVYIYIEVGVFKTHVKLMTLGSLGEGNHSKFPFLSSYTCQ